MDRCLSITANFTETRHLSTWGITIVNQCVMGKENKMTIEKFNAGSTSLRVRDNYGIVTKINFQLRNSLKAS